MSEKIILTGLALPIGEVSHNGRIYSRQAVEKAFEDFKKRVEEGRALGNLEPSDSPLSIELDNVSHKVTHVNLDDKGIHADIEVLNTPKGKIVKAIAEGGLPLYTAIRGVGKVNKKGEVNLDQLISIDLVSQSPFRSANVLRIKE